MSGADWPSEPMRVVVPYSVGSIGDLALGYLAPESAARDYGYIN